MAFRQHLQNLARTKGILELNKVQMLVEQMGSGEGGAMGPMGPQHHLHNLLEVSADATNSHTHFSPYTFLSCRFGGLYPRHGALGPLSCPRPRDHRRGKTTVARACCVTLRGAGQLWLVYCQQSHWGPGAQGQSECWPLLDSSRFKPQRTGRHEEWKGKKKNPNH